MHDYHGFVTSQPSQTLHGPTPVFFAGGEKIAALAQVASMAGWHAVVVPKGESTAHAFSGSGAPVCVIDARGRLEKALNDIRALADPVELNAAALLVILGNRDVGALDRLVDAGVTHYLASSFSDAELVAAIRLAERHAIRLAGEAAGPRAAADVVGLDALTGLGNAASARRWIDLRLKSSRSVHVLLLAITRFEMVNAAFGRETGDDILNSVARMIVPLVAEVGGRQVLVARTAAAEFIIGIEGLVEETRLRLLAEQLVDQVERPLLSGTHVVTLSSRIAVATSGEGEKDASPLLRRASGLLADAIAIETTHIRFSPGNHADIAAVEEELKADLRGALDRKEIDLLFQPQVSVASGKIVGVEALARWKHPRFGELGASTLFAAASQSDYITALSAHIQREALRIASLWPDVLAGLRMAINITANDIARPGFADGFLALVDSSGFPRGKLTVEVTESGLIDDLNTAATLLAQLRAGGCRVAIDDFGTGYSSLAYLKSLPLDYLKIDQKLAQDICGTPRDRIVVRGIIDMARSLGLAVIAEGVETEEQLTLLAREGCNYYQGFLCAEPVDVAGLDTLVRTWPQLA